MKGFPTHLGISPMKQDEKKGWKEHLKEGQKEAKERVPFPKEGGLPVPDWYRKTQQTMAGYELGLYKHIKSKFSGEKTGKGFKTLAKGIASVTAKNKTAKHLKEETVGSKLKKDLKKVSDK